jgi:protein-tyrosine-phosphatase
MKTVLFVGTQNAGRSRIAEALFNRMAPDDVRGSPPARIRAARASGRRSSR